VLGCANIAVRSLIPALSKHAAFELVAIASRSRDKAGPLARQYGCQAMEYGELVGATQVDAVYVPLPTGLHAEWVGKCLGAGKHVLCEKSLGCTLLDVQQMVDLARAKHVLLMENFQFRFHSQQRYVKDVLSTGRLGAVRCFRSSFGFPPFSDGAANIRYQKALGGGALFDAGAYTLKATTFMFGHEFRVKAATIRYSSEHGVDVGGAIYLERPDGLVSETAFGFDNFYQCNYEVWGSKGKLTARRAFTAPPGYSPEIDIESAAGVERLVLPPDDHFANMLTYFSESIARQTLEHEYEECLAQARLLQQVWELGHVCGGQDKSGRKA
jgi:predicted dehydrogenase